MLKDDTLLKIIAHFTAKPYGHFELTDTGYLIGFFSTEIKANYFLGYACGYVHALGWNIDWYIIQNISEDKWRLTIRLGNR